MSGPHGTGRLPVSNSGTLGSEANVSIRMVSQCVGSNIALTGSLVGCTLKLIGAPPSRAFVVLSSIPENRIHRNSLIGRTTSVTLFHVPDPSVALTLKKTLLFFSGWSTYNLGPFR